MIESFISANMVDSSKAVTIYLAISISHLPNSFFMLQKYKKLYNYATFSLPFSENNAKFIKLTTKGYSLFKRHKDTIINLNDNDNEDEDEDPPQPSLLGRDPPKSSLLREDFLLLLSAVSGSLPKQGGLGWVSGWGTVVGR